MFTYMPGSVRMSIMGLNSQRVLSLLEGKEEPRAYGQVLLPCSDATKGIPRPYRSPNGEASCVDFNHERGRLPRLLCLRSCLGVQHWGVPGKARFTVISFEWERKSSYAK